MNFALTFCIIAAVMVLGAYAQGPEKKEKICEPGTVFMDNCNKCRCTKDGYDKSCTRIACLGDLLRRRRASSEYCVPGSTYKMQCNDCVCPRSGLKSQAACTLKLCI